VINADDQFRDDWVARSRCEFTVTFGFAESADCRVVGEPQFMGTGSEFRMRLPDGEETDVWLPLLGRQNVANALAAAAATQAVGASTEDIVAGLARATPVRGRLRAVAGRGGATVIDDSYNANPGSVHAALDHLAALGGTRILVLGNMAELGPTGPALHREVGEYARGRCDQLVAIGELAAEAATAFGATGRRVPDIEAARATLEPLLGADVTVLVKGSRVMGLDRLVKALEKEVARSA
jgi:UDP-N-acetylmuramoyl-tripeptide--D-alanyl-D-alanine ligase